MKKPKKGETVELSMEAQLLLDLASKDYVLYAPKGASSLKIDYPELADYPEFKQLNPSEMLFVWAYACKSSPFLAISEDGNERLKACIDYAYTEGSRRENKYRDLIGREFPDEVSRAVGRMRSFSKSARVETYVYIKQLRENCKKAIAEDVSIMDMDQSTKYWANAQKAHKILSDTRSEVERGAYGVSEEGETLIDEARNYIGDFHKSNR